MFTWLDLIVVLIVAISTATGFYFGFIQSAGNIVGLVIGILVGGRMTKELASVFSLQPIAQIVLFIILFLLLTKLTGVLFWLIKKIYGFFHFIPFTKSFERILGGVLGFLEGAALCGVAIYYAYTLIPLQPIQTFIDESPIAHNLSIATKPLQYLLPNPLRRE